MKKICLMVGMVLLFGLICGQNGLADDKILVKSPSLISEQKYVPGEIIVKFKPGVSEKVIANINSRHGTSVISTSRFAGFKRLKIPRRKTVEEAVEIYKRNPNVEYAEPNYIVHAFLVPNDKYYSYQWHLDNSKYGGINMEAAWDIETGDPSVIVAVIDTGVAYENYGGIYYQASDLANTNFVAGYDFVNNDAHPNDDEGHGTHVTGTIAQSTNNSIGVAGVAFNTSIMPIKVLDSNGEGTYANVADGIMFAADNNAQVANISLGGPSPSDTLENAVAYAYNQGVTLICASGNDGSKINVSYPAAYDAYCIAVGATRYDEKVAYYSNGGSSLDLVAPGGDLRIDQNRDGYADGVLQQTFDSAPDDWGYWFYQGTSMAAPHVSGVAALLLAKGVVTAPDEVRTVLQTTAEDKGTAGWDKRYGYGIVDAYAALTYVPEPPDTTPPVISDVAASNITDTTATITWTTDEPATSRVDYGITSDYGSVVADGALVTVHSINLSGLTPQTTYHYKVTSTDAADNTVSSADATFTTTATPPPAPVSVAITRVNAGDVRKGTYNIRAQIQNLGDSPASITARCTIYDETGITEVDTLPDKITTIAVDSKVTVKWTDPTALTVGIYVAEVTVSEDPTAQGSDTFSIRSSNSKGAR